MKTIISKSLEETDKIAKEWLDGVSKHQEGAAATDEATVVCLSGHLGAGKTAFVKAVAKNLEIEDVVTSPTFVIMKFYDISSDLNLPWDRLVHIDAYRLERGEEMEALKFEEVVANPRNLIMIEWPENIESALSSIENKIEMKLLRDKDGSVNLSY